MCNLSQKEQTSLFAVLTKRQGKTLPKNLHLVVEKLFISFWPMDLQFRKRLNKKRVNWGKTQRCRWKRPRGGRGPAGCAHVAQRRCDTLRQPKCATFLSPSGFS